MKLVNFFITLIEKNKSGRIIYDFILSSKLFYDLFFMHIYLKFIPIL